YKALLEAEKPQIRVLVNAAGYGLFGTFEEMGLEEQLGIVDVNDKALTAMCLLSLPYMRKGDAIVNLGSNSSWQPVPYLNVYAASKAYVLSFSRGLGRELKPRGVHVMCVCPGWIRTEFMDTAVHDDTIQYYDRWYTPEQVIEQAMKDLKKKKKVSILGAPVRRQVRLVKFLPTDVVLDTWCRQQGKE
nr:SDR family NAD(P)-dependent oxidoreductase [Clostridia bacterium]